MVCTSTIGLSPATVIVSSSAPIFSSAFTVETKSAGSNESFALDRGESGQRERHGIGARPQVDDAVLAGTIADGRPDFLDQLRARCFDGHAGQDCPRRVSDDARNRRRLGVGSCRKDSNAGNDDEPPGQSQHRSLSLRSYSPHNRDEVDDRSRATIYLSITYERRDSRLLLERLSCGR